MPLIFVVDGLADRRALLQFVLEQAGHQVAVFASAQALEAGAEQKPAAMIIASTLPDGSGIALRRLIGLRGELSNTGIVMLMTDEIDEHVGKISPVDEILHLPLLPERVLEAVDSVIHWEPPPPSGSFPRSTEVLIDVAAMKISINGREITTTTLEFRLIEYMSRHQGKVFTRDALLDAVWGDLQFVTPRSVDACIRRIRRKVSSASAVPEFLRTIRGVGYKLDAQPKWATGGEICDCKVCTAVRLRAQPFPELRPRKSAKTLGRDAFLN